MKPTGNPPLNGVLPGADRGRVALMNFLTPRQWLLLGVAFTALVGMRWNISGLAWVMPVPFLLYLRSAHGWRAQLWLLAALQLGVFLQILKMVTEPIPWPMAALFSVPLALGSWLAYMGFERLRRRLGDGWGLLLFPALVIALEWLGWRWSEFGSWGALANTQVGNLPLLQTTALVGLAGPALLLSLVAAWLAVVIADTRPTRWWRSGLAIALLVLIAHAWGSYRLHQPLAGPQITVAGIVSDLALGAEGIPAAEILQAGTDELFLRTRLAAQRGARLVVWNEGATVIHSAEETAFLRRGTELAQNLGVDIVMAYIVPLDGMAKFENKYVWITSEGGIAETYFKHHPVPGEGSIKGTAPLRVLNRPYGRVAGAICYDYDFPALGLRHARLGAGLVVVPSSDWQGIDPYHTQMASIRGIEGGFSVLRPVRWATSGAFDAYGRSRASLSHFEANDRIMLASVPVERIPTLYARTGDWLPVLALLFVLLASVRALGFHKL
ncbi:MAG TPA: nitrilase [Chromatiales bacterium]|nr:nitrilase [Chromatiales bacterium]HEX22722.1 nitrilase [Chromatiales bacterium]